MALFEGLSEKLQDTMRKLRGATRVSEKDIKDVMRQIKLALLEADVNFKVVKEFISVVSEKSLKQDVLESLTPGQQIVKIVNDELINILGVTESKITFSSSPPTVYMLVGLQGAGKTTHAAKLASMLRKEGKKPIMIACDVYRPAAIKQLQILGKQIDIPVFADEGSKNPVDIAKKGIKSAITGLNDVVIIDTAGRLHVDEELMNELKNIKKDVSPQEILLVIDSMTGQDAVNVAESFDTQLGIDGVILTKMDGDTRGGAALSVRYITGKPIKFAGTGEKISDLEPFYPDRIASRILGMGDVLSLIEKAQDAFDEKKAAELQHKMSTAKFTLEDYLEQLQQMKNLGPMSNVLGMIPGMNAKMMKNINVEESEKKMQRIEAMIHSMTPKERLEPNILNSSRRKRIAAGSGTTVPELNKMLSEFENTKKMMKSMMSGSKRMGKKGLGNMNLPF